MDQSVSHVKVEDIEAALSEVGEIKAARVVASPEGVIQEIHVLGAADQAAKAAGARHRVDADGALQHPDRPQEDIDRFARQGLDQARDRRRARRIAIRLLGRASARSTRP